MVVAGYFLLVSSALHIIGFVLTGYSSDNLFLVFPAALYIFLSLGLMKHMVWVAWIAFICMLGGMAGTLIEIYGPSTINPWILWGILGADFLVAAFLFKSVKKSLTTKNETA